MAQFDEGGFDAVAVDPNVGFDPIPAGKYLCVITDSEEKPNAKGTGTYINFTLEVIEGEHKGRKLWERLNLKNPSEEAVKIARAVLSSMCRAVGVMSPRDSVDLHNLPMLVKVGMEKRADTGEITNRIRGYEAKAGVAAKPAQAPPATPPWKKK